MSYFCIDKIFVIEEHTYVLMWSKRKTKSKQIKPLKHNGDRIKLTNKTKPEKILKKNNKNIIYKKKDLVPVSTWKEWKEASLIFVVTNVNTVSFNLPK